QRPVSKSVRPSYMCRSEPQMFVVVIRTRTSVGRSIRASGPSLTLTWRGPSYTTAFTLPPRRGGSHRSVLGSGGLHCTQRCVPPGIGRHADTRPDGHGPTTGTGGPADGNRTEVTPVRRTPRSVSLPP